MSHLRFINTAKIVETAPIYAKEPEYPIPYMYKIISCAKKEKIIGELLLENFCEIIISQ